jgi:hypothetical protein
MNIECKITVEEIVKLRIALNNAECRVKELMSLKSEVWHKLYNIDMDSIKEGKEVLTNVIKRD